MIKEIDDSSVRRKEFALWCLIEQDIVYNTMYITRGWALFNENGT